MCILLKKDLGSLKNIKLRPRLIVSILKNEPDYLDFFLNSISVDYECYISAGTYFFEDVINDKTFDIYKKYNVSSTNCFKELMSKEQWEYLLKIGFIEENEDKQSL